MKRREFLQKIGVSAAVLATIDAAALGKPVSKEAALRIDQSNTDEPFVKFVEVEVEGQEYSIPIYTHLGGLS